MRSEGDVPLSSDGPSVPVIGVAWGNLTEVIDALLAIVPSFWADAACRGMWGKVDYFPGRGGVQSTPRSLCSACSVRLDCLQFALESDERFGIWGGLSERERARLRARMDDGEPIEDIIEEQRRFGCPTGLPHQHPRGGTVA
jgi:WhiB family transcriptional regulator, redox-sensing transcriptional regulator